MKYPIGVQNFESLRQDGYLYIDKTELVYKLVSEGRYYFLSRPRRFGKSLLISTLEAYFQGKKELFKGLAIDTLEKEWTARPVLHIDLNARQYENADSLRQEINKHLELWETAYNSPYGDRALEERFYHVIPPAPGHRQQAPAGGIPKHTQAVLRCAQDHGRAHQVRDADRCHKIRQSQRIQRPQQLE